MKKEKFSLKDHLFNKEKVIYFSKLLKKADKNFPEKKFTKEVLENFPQLELKERIFLMRQKLEEFLPQKFEKSAEIILKALPPEFDSKKTDDDFGDFILAPFQYFVAKNGNNKKDLKLSLKTLSEITKRFTTEDGIRYFINSYPKETFSFLQKMSKSKNYHQRRLSSEGLRPNLPWCISINFSYKKGAEILDNLYFDKTRYVVRSVANHLNDISKIDSDFVIEKLIFWQKENKQNEDEFRYLKTHSLRTLLKDGNDSALNFLGYKKNIKIKNFKFFLKKKKIFLGENLDFQISFENFEKENILLNYKIYFLKKNRNLISKTFRIKKFSSEKNKKYIFDKKHSFAEISTKKYYSGKHKIEIILNGKILASENFDLKI